MTAQVIPVEAILGKPDFKYQKVQYRRHVWQPGFGPPEEEAPPEQQMQSGTSSSSMYIRSKDYGFQRNVWTPGDVEYDSEVGSQWKAPEGYEGVYDASVWGIPTDGDMLPVIDIDWDELSRRKAERDARLAAEEEAARLAAEAALAAAGVPEAYGPPMGREEYDRMIGLGGQKELGGPLGGEYVTPTEEDRPVDMQAQAQPGGGGMPGGTEALSGDSAARKGHELNRRKLGVVTRPSTLHDMTYGKTAEGGKGAQLYQRRQKRVVQFSKEDIRSFKPWLSLIYLPPTEVLPYFGRRVKEEPAPPQEPAPALPPKKPGQKVMPKAPMTPWSAAMQTSGDVEPAFTHLRKPGAPFATYLEKGMMGDQPETVGAVQAVMGAAEGKRGGAGGDGRGGAGGGAAFAGDGGGVGDGAYGSGFHVEKVSAEARGEYQKYRDFNRSAKGWFAVEGAETYDLSESEAASRGLFAVRQVDTEADVWRPDPSVVKAILQQRSELQLPEELAGLPESEDL
ncbi:Hypp7230 [Branchiostoma lanceolatum]|uniref:Hypp7230 protein n=1 Tax=Branchiostoma lanceolatum TaxID=7740 RepID=A0A8J9YYZ3_BRALA|nr:Hypp7230 [Branchiostoma lanceolatum]